jgi:hypothetical protein
VDAQAIEKVLHMCSGIEKTYNSYIHIREWKPVTCGETRWNLL